MLHIYICYIYVTRIHMYSVAPECVYSNVAVKQTGCLWCLHGLKYAASYKHDLPLQTTLLALYVTMVAIVHQCTSEA